MAFKRSELNKLDRALSNVKDSVMEACAETILDITEDIYEDADATVPVLTENLRNSLRINLHTYSMQRSLTSIYGEVHFGEPGHRGGWYGDEAYGYMWSPGYDDSNWMGLILYAPWDEHKERFIPELTENIRSKFQ